MYRVEVDETRRLIVISAAGHVTKEEVRAAAVQVRELVKDFAPGFCTLVDFGWLESMDSAAAHHIAEMMDAVAEKQVGSVVRVVPDPHKDIGLNILSRFHYGPGIEIATFEKLADAVQSLVRPDDISGEEEK